ncbi:unnamed protein product [Dracunculus medinensis]|uniref:Sema domain-containing protein n=1 Tax=Dracunculus medinensis TaxID=318479 RepID=A0A0N4UE47_DRAME|nr:unnamed protein product [Dracunculus medinensis]
MLPYRSYYVAGRCYYGVTRSSDDENACEAVKLNPKISTMPQMASIENRNLLEVLKQSSVFNPNVAYKVKFSFDGSKTFMKGSEEGYLCEIRDPSLCPKGFKKMNDKCFKLNTYAENMEKAADNCREQNTKSSLAPMHETLVGRRRVEYGLESFSRIIIGPILGTTKKATRFHITDGMYTQKSVKSAKSNTAVILHSTTNDKQGKTHFGYWSNTFESEKHLYFCQTDPLSEFTSDTTGLSEQEEIIPLKPSSPTDEGMKL